MKFDAFIDANLDAIVAEWTAFARTLLPAATAMSELALRNHSREILIAVAEDMRTSQSEAERSAKSRQAQLAPGASQTVAAAHGALRHAAGFEMAQVVAEFRALRSSVVLLWRHSQSTGGKMPAIEEIARFNEAIDQALGESVQRYSNDVAASRDMFLAVLGHDLRSPLQGVETASLVLAMPALSEAARLQTAIRVRRAAKMMSGLITDLLDYTRSRLGRGIPIEWSDCDLARVCEEALDAVRASNPEQEFAQHMSGDLRIAADRARLRQVLSNLLNNAVQHGDRGAPVSLSAHGEEESVVLAIANAGKPIAADDLRLIFEPLVQVPSTSSDLSMRPKTSLGLGLFIVREIVLGHHGTIDVQSAAHTGTVFTIRLPRANHLDS
ncbi:MAG: HAMP domain-containing histidine kinase [Pseudomonadota bacterium]|nr:HAMP domain-containing histidine kinase [Pseudomonadota bacterium]